MRKPRKPNDLGRAVAAAQKNGAKVERERIRARLKAIVDSLRTSRDDDYGAGWNGALSMITASLEPLS